MESRADTAVTHRIIALGNTMAADDGVGPWIVRRLEALVPAGIEVCWVPAPGPELLFELERPGEVTFIDAALDEASEPGTILQQTIEPDEEPRLKQARCLVSTHGLSLAELLRLARVLKRHRARVHLFGIVGRRFEPGEGLSPEVERAAQRLVERICAGDFTDNGNPDAKNPSESPWSGPGNPV
jgi:hydrogenase maturation protease